MDIIVLSTITFQALSLVALIMMVGTMIIRAAEERTFKKEVSLLAKRTLKEEVTKELTTLSGQCDRLNKEYARLEKKLRLLKDEPIFNGESTQLEDDPTFLEEELIKIKKGLDLLEEKCNQLKEISDNFADNERKTDDGGAENPSQPTK